MQLGEPSASITRVNDVFGARFVLHWEGSSEPAPGFVYILVLADGSTIRGVSDSLGRTLPVSCNQAEIVQLEVIGPA